ncbi:MAG: universal stress protein [Solirubrobacteraceae bacterium]
MSSTTPRPAIVVGYDGSDASRAALLFAARQAGSRGRVFVVHAFELPPDLLGSPNYEAILSHRRDRGEALLKELPLDEEPLVGPAYELELIGGPAAEVIERVARVRDADEIVVGARGLGRMRALLGSISHELLHIADRPVVVIPTAAVQPGVQGSVAEGRGAPA